MPRTLAITACAAVLAGCASLSQPMNEDNYLMRIPTGSQLVLKREIVIPERWARVAFQDGQMITNRRDIDRSRGYCELFTNQTSQADALTVIKPGAFETGVENRPTVIADQGQLLFASAFIFPGEENGKSWHIFRTIVPLASVEQPSVNRLVCEYTENPIFFNHLTINQIRDVLGDTFELKLAQR